MMRSDNLGPGLVIVLALSISGLAIVERWRSEDRRHHGGRVTTVVTTAAGPIRIELRTAEYTRGNMRVAGSRTRLLPPRLPATRLDLWASNSGETTVAILPGKMVEQGGACQVLVDGAGRQYPVRAATWGRRAGEPDRDVGQLLPGWGAGFVLEFPGISTGSGALTLVLDCLAADNTPLEPLRLPVPLP